MPNLNSRVKRLWDAEYPPAVMAANKRFGDCIHRHIPAMLASAAPLPIDEQLRADLALVQAHSKTHPVANAAPLETIPVVDWLIRDLGLLEDSDAQQARRALMEWSREQRVAGVDPDDEFRRLLNLCIERTREAWFAPGAPLVRYE